MLLMMFFGFKEIPVEIWVLILNFFKLCLLKISELILLLLLFLGLLHHFCLHIVLVLLLLRFVGKQKRFDDLSQFFNIDFIQLYLEDMVPSSSVCQYSKNTSVLIPLWRMVSLRYSCFSSIDITNYNYVAQSDEI